MYLYVCMCMMTFVLLSCTGPSHMSLYLMPHRGASLSTWSFGDGTPQFDLSGEYFIFYSHGLDAPTWTFWFEIQVLPAAWRDIPHLLSLLTFHIPALLCELFKQLLVSGGNLRKHHRCSVWKKNCDGNISNVIMTIRIECQILNISL